MAVAPERANGPKEPRIVCRSLASAFKDTFPVPPPPTVTGMLKFWPELSDVVLGEPSVVVVAVRVAELHSVRRLPTLIEPNPVAKS